MWPNGVIKCLDIGEDGVGGLVMSQEISKVQRFTFEAAEEVFGDGIVIGVAFAAHALTNACGGKGGTKMGGGILNATVGMKDQPRSGSLTP